MADLFAKFLTNNTAEIDAKLRSCSDIEDQRDNGLELFVAYMFLNGGFEVIYEPSKKGPDFLLRLGKEHCFCEVRRIRENLDDSETGILDFRPNDYRKIGDIICEKFLQIKVGEPNIIYIRSNRFLIDSEYLPIAMTSLYRMASEGNANFFARKKFNDHADFLQRAASCSLIILEDLWPPFGDKRPEESIYHNTKSRFLLSDEMLYAIKQAMKISFRKH